MKKITSLLLFASVFLYSCIGESYQPLPKTELISDNSSKVWIVKSEKINGEEVNPSQRKERNCFTFYRDYFVVKNRLKNFGSNRIKKGKFSVNDGGKAIVFKWNNESKKETWKIMSQDVDELFLVNPLENKSMVLIPLDKP